MTESIDGARYLQMIRGGVAVLNARRQEINDLNVFPIPDGDTGDNMFMTLEAGQDASAQTLSEAASAAAKGMLMSARGNSGVILSRIFAGIAKGLEGCPEADVRTFGRAMECGVQESYGAVSEPVEGTILTVLREGVKGAGDCRDFEEYFERLVSAMDLALARTPEQLAVLKQAGVVDSGGAGLLAIVEGMRNALTGEVEDVAAGESRSGALHGRQRARIRLLHGVPAAPAAEQGGPGRLRRAYPVRLARRPR